MPRTAAALALAVVAGLTLSACGATKQAGCGRCTAQLAQIRADTLASVAARIYRQEVSGAANYAAFDTIAHLPLLQRGLAGHASAQARQALRTQPIRHAVRARIVRRGRVLVDVGLPFVIAGTPRPVVTPAGRVLGEMEVSIQDVLGFVKLIIHLTGTQVVVRGSLDNHVYASLPALLGVGLPASGPVRIGRHRYVVSSLTRPGFAGEQLRVWVLATA